MNGGELRATYSDARCIFCYGSGAVLIQGGTITSGGSCLYESVGNYSSESLTISEGIITNYGTGSYSDAIYSQDNGEINISGDARIFSENRYGIWNAGDASINISGGEVIGKDYAIFNSGGAIEISGGSVRATGTAIYSYDNVVEISGGKVEGSTGIWSYGRIIVSGDALIKGTSSYGILNMYISTDISDPAVVISSGTVEGRFGAIDNFLDGLIRIDGGYITGGESALYAIFNEKSGTIDISGGTISGGDPVNYNLSTGNIEVSDQAEISHHTLSMFHPHEYRSLRSGRDSF